MWCSSLPSSRWRVRWCDWLKSACERPALFQTLPVWLGSSICLLDVFLSGLIWAQLEPRVFSILSRFGPSSLGQSSVQNQAELCMMQLVVTCRLAGMNGNTGVCDCCEAAGWKWWFYPENSHTKLFVVSSFLFLWQFEDGHVGSLSDHFRTNSASLNQTVKSSSSSSSENFWWADVQCQSDFRRTHL